MAVARTRTSKRSTARSRAAAVRQAAEDHNHRIMDALNRTMARIEFDLDGTVQDVNSNFLSVMGYTSDEVIGQHHSMFVDEATRHGAAYADFWARLRSGAAPPARTV